MPIPHYHHTSKLKSTPQFPQFETHSTLPLSPNCSIHQSTALLPCSQRCIEHNSAAPLQGLLIMGNANGREDGGSDTQSVAEDSAAAQVSMADQQAPEYMGGHSPPSSPRASQSPLMFRPQVSSLLLIFMLWGFLLYFIRSWKDWIFIFRCYWDCSKLYCI